MNREASTIAREFYITGGTLRRDALCYVVRRSDAEFYESLKRGEFCYVLTARQMGKSSLMVRTAARMREEGVGVAVLDLTAIGQNLTAEQWYGGLLSQIGQQLDLEDDLDQLLETHPKLGPLQRWMGAIREVVLPRYPGPVVIFIDEIDTVRSLPFATDEFFAGIRQFYNRRPEDPDLERLTFCLLGVASPSDLIRDTRMTPFNIGERIELEDFTEEEARPLAQGLGRAADAAALLLRRILHWTGGHPYLTQRLCRAVAEDRAAQDEKGVDALCGTLFLAHRAKERDDNLLFVRERLLGSEVDLAGLLGLYQRVLRGKKVPDDETNPQVSVLRLSGVACVSAGFLKVRNRIYAGVFDRRWTAENIPDAELRRQRAAYRKGLLRAGVLAALIITAIAALAILAVQQRDRAREEAARADRNLEAAERNAAEARQALAEAKRQAQETDRQRNLAETERLKADQQRGQADVARGEAERARLFAEQQSEEARRRGAGAQQQRSLAEQQRASALEKSLEAEEQRSVAEQERGVARRQSYAANLTAADLHLRSNDVAEAKRRLMMCAADLRGWEWRYLMWKADSSKATVCTVNVRLSNSAPQAPLAAGIDGKRVFWSSSETLYSWTAPGYSSPTAYQGLGQILAFSRDGLRVVSASEQQGDWNLRVYDPVPRSGSIRPGKNGLLYGVYSYGNKGLSGETRTSGQSIRLRSKTRKRATPSCQIRTLAPYGTTAQADRTTS